jgi:hypothetical protein
MVIQYLKELFDRFNNPNSIIAIAVQINWKLVSQN